MPIQLDEQQMATSRAELRLTVEFCRFNVPLEIPLTILTLPRVDVEGSPVPRPRPGTTERSDGFEYLETITR